MNRRTFRILLLPVMISFGLISAINIAAQCGLPGTPPCPPKNPPASAKSSGGNAAKASVDLENAERERLERQRIAVVRLKKKQQANSQTSATPQWLKNVVAYNKMMKDAKTLDLFPVANVTLGKTGGKYLSLMGENCGITDANGNLTNCYQVEEISFYCDDNNVSDSLYFSHLRLAGMPEEWRKLGFNWGLSYNEWTNLLKKQGYSPYATEKPQIVTQSGKRFLKAELSTLVKTSSGIVTLRLNFNFGAGKTTVDDKETLFSIVVDR